MFRCLVPVVAVFLIACTPLRSTMAPYRDDAEAARRLAEKARATCADLRGQDDLPPHAFTTDGCSAAPDGPWASCCVEHDAAYWCGGTAGRRREVDRRLARCIRERGGSAMQAALAVAATRVGGVPWSGLPWRWGYGWDGIRGYETAASEAGGGAGGEAAER